MTQKSKRNKAARIRELRSEILTLEGRVTHWMTEHELRVKENTGLKEKIEALAKELIEREESEPVAAE